MVKISLKKINFTWIIIALTPIFIFGMFYFRASPKIQFQILVLGAIIYLITTLLYHHQTKTLSLEIIIEYVLIAALVLLIFQGFLI